MGLMESLLGQEGVNLTGGGVVYDPTKDNWETRFDSEGNPYQARVGTPLHPGHTSEDSGPMFNQPSVDVPTPQSNLNYGNDYYSGQQTSPTIPDTSQGLLKPSYEQQLQDEYWNMYPPLENTKSGTFTPQTPTQDLTGARNLMQDWKTEQGARKQISEEQFNNAMNKIGMGDFMNQYRSSMNNVGESLDRLSNDNTDDFGNPISRNVSGETTYDNNARNQQVLDDLMMQDRDVAKVARPQSNATDYWNKNADITRKSQDFVRNLGGNIADGATDLYEGAKDLYNDFNKDEPVDNRTWAEKRADDTKYYKDLATDTGSTIVDTATDAWEGISDAYKKYGVPADKWVTGKMIDAYDKGLPDTVTDTYNTLSKGTEDIVRAVPGAYSRGVGNMVKLGKTLGNVALGEERFDETDGGIITPRKPDYNYPMLGEGAEVMGSYVGGMGAGIKLASKAPNLVKYFSAIGGGTTTTDPTEGNLSTWIQDTDYRNAVTEFLNSETSEEANSLEKLKAYGKNFLEEG